MKSRSWLFASLFSLALGVLLIVGISRAPGPSRVGQPSGEAGSEVGSRHVASAEDRAPTAAPLAVPGETPKAAPAPAAVGSTAVEPSSPPAAPVAAVVPAVPAVPAPADVVIVAPAGHVPLPAAFQPTAWDARLTPGQRAKLNAIQEELIQGTGGTYHDPASPHYRDRWREAQRRSDEQFKEAFGMAAFISRQMAMAREQ